MGLFKRGPVWWMSFSYQGRQVRRSTGTSDRRLAEAILGKVKVQIVEGRYFERREEQTRTFAEMMERYETEHVPKLASQRAIRGYLRRLRPVFGHLTLAEITPQRIVAYKQQRYRDGVAPATINRELATMKHAFNLAIREWEWCRENPVSRVSMEKEASPRDRWLTREEEARLLEASPPWLNELVLFGLHTGMRLGEMLALTWRGVDLFRNTVTVFRSKNGRRRTIPLNQTARALLKAKAKVRALHTEHVFQSEAHTPLDPNNVRRAFRRAVEQAEIEELHFHDLRHTFATRLVQAGVDLYKVQCLLGHQSPVMTQRYAHHSPESLRDGVATLDRTGESITILAQPGDAAEAHRSVTG
jgi:site-specific recombinase XerD